MENDEHVVLLMQGADAWNAWRDDNPDIRPDLGGADLTGANLSGANLGGANLIEAKLPKALIGADLTGANLSGANLAGASLMEAKLPKANLIRADLTGADLSRANLTEADLNRANLLEADLDRAKLPKANLSGANLNRTWLVGANLIGADLSGAELIGAQLWGANLGGANLAGANLQLAVLVGTDLSGADLTGCRVFGISAWAVKISEDTKQHNLVVTPEDESAVMVDDLEVAQFVYLLLDRKKIRNVMDAVTRRGVLILGRFGDGGIALLQALAAWLRKPENGGYLPLLFDFPRPEAKTYTDTIRTLAGLARFVIVDLSGPSVPQEITATVDLYEIPFVPILEKGRKDWSMFRDFLVKERVLKPPVRFIDQDHLFKQLAKKVIAPSEKLIKQRQKRLDEIFGRSSLRDRTPRAGDSRRSRAKSGM